MTIINDQYPVLTSSRKGIFFQKDYYDGNQIASENNIGYNIVPYGYFTYRHMSDDEIFYFNINNIIDNGIVSTLYPVFTTNNRLDSKFLQYELNFGKEFRKYSVLQKQGGSRTYMYFNKLRDLKLTITTSLKEQEYIRNLICSIDHLITLHQSKSFGHILKVIVSCTLSWEQRKLGEVANRFDSTRIPISENLRVSGKTPYYGANGIQDYVDGYTHDGEYVLIAEDGANDLKNYPIRLVKGRIWVNNHAHVIQGMEKFMNNQFINFAMSQVDFESIVVGCGRAKLNAEQLMDICFKIPNKNEQANIGRLFESINHLITLHQSKSFGHILKVIVSCTLSWEQRKLGEVANRFDSTRIPISENLRVSGKTPYYGANGIQDYVDGYTHDGEYVLIAEDGANDLKNYPIRLVKGRIWVNNHAHVIQGMEKFMNNQFINFAMSQVDFESIVVGCGRAKLNAEQLMDICFKIPNKNEQANIGRLFESINHLITLHQLEPYKLIFKAIAYRIIDYAKSKPPRCIK